MQGYQKKLMFKKFLFYKNKKGDLESRAPRSPFLFLFLLKIIGDDK